ncbi:MAG: hypothetical protein OXT51_01460 [Chloroflexota bacterium]|nr:hypothetical protein [Chloroflexota bacterium]
MPERFQQEIEEILEQSEAQAPHSRPRRSGRPKTERPAGTGNLITPGRIIIAAVALLLTFALIFDGTLATAFLWSALVAGVIGYAFFFVRADRADNKLHWRGKPVEYDSPPGGPSFWDKLTRRFRR